MTVESPFIPRSAITNSRNLQKYIYHAKNECLLWGDVPSFDWDENVWRLARNTVRFLKFDVNLHKSIIPTVDQIFGPEYIDFAKAFILNSCKGRQYKDVSKQRSALQVVEAALIKINGSADITKLSEVHLDYAVELIRKQYVGVVGIGLALQELVEEVVNNNITPSAIRHWKHPFRRSGRDPNYYKGSTKLPSDEAILALAEIFSNGYNDEIDDESVYITGIACVFLSAPMRIGEQTWLNLNSLEEGMDANDHPQKFLRYFVAKTQKTVTKEIPEIMAELCGEAFRRLKKITEEGRKLALYYESGSELFYPHPDCPIVDPDQVLTRDQVVAALGRANIGTAQSLVKRMVGDYSLTGWTLKTLWAAVVQYNKHKNTFFPYQVDPCLYRVKPPKMSESLLCFRMYQLSSGFTSSPILLAPINGDYFATRLSKRERDHKRGDLSFFDRHGYGNIILGSHQLRHFLNTAAEEAGVNIERITAWSGRASVQQSRTYMHKDPARTSRQAGDHLLEVKDVTSVPITEEEYDIRDKGPIITTRYGICTHPWTVSACEKSADCLNCSELLHCKGHKKSLAAVVRERDHVAENLEASLKEIALGNRAATRWVQHHQHYLARLNDIVAMHTNPAIEDGSPVQMLGSDFTQAKRIISNKHPERLKVEELSGVYGSDLLECLKELMKEDDDA
jgi:hypothetical protein